MSDEEKEMWEWLKEEICSKCGLTVLSEDSQYYHCENCREESIRTSLTK